MKAHESKPGSPTELTPASRNRRLAAIGGLIVGLAALFIYAGGWLTPHKLSPAVMVDTFEKVNGEYPGFRRNHAKGVCVTGTFESNGKGMALSRAAVFQPGQIPVLGRFAFAGGLPYVPDAPGIVRSLALLFQLPNGEEWRSAMINLPVFPVNNPQAFHDLLVASAPDKATGKPDPARMGAFFAEYPDAAKALALIKANPVSSDFTNSSYNSLNAFLFTDAQGKVIPVRWSLVPFQSFKPIEETASGTADKNYLFDALITAIHGSPLQWHLIITLGKEGDSTRDANQMWPSDREQIDVGTLTINRIESEDSSPIRDINFDPLILPKGMAGSDDPLLSARSATYSQSFTRREGEPKSPSAVSTAETEQTK